MRRVFNSAIGRAAILGTVALVLSVPALAQGLPAPRGVSAPRSKLAATAAAPSNAASLKQLKRALAHAATASSHHHPLSAKAYRQIGKLAKGLEQSLVNASADCRSGLAAATRLAGDRNHAARLRSDLKHARSDVTSCSATAAQPPYVPPQSGSPTPTDVGGVVLNSAGQPLASLPITVDVDDPFALYGKEWTTTTDGTGHFTVPYPISENESWYSWTATTEFPWYGGTWPRDLSTVSESDPANIVFQSNLSQGAQIAVSDETGCDVFWQNPAYPGSNPTTKSISVTLTPVGELIDGTTATARTVTFPQGQLCDGSIGVPPGAWTVSNGVDNLGRALIFSTDGGNTYTSSVEVFNAPPNGAWPTVSVDTRFASPPSS
jgi:hypothetical protein